MAEPFSPDQIFIRKITDIILANLAYETFGVKELAHQAGMSRSGLTKRLNRITGKNTNQFIREIRLRKALEMLQNEGLTASEVAYKVGFGSPSYFNTCFHEFFGYPPGKAKNLNLDSQEKELSFRGPAEKEQRRFFAWDRNTKMGGIFILAILIIASGILFYPKLLKKNTLEDLRSSDGRISIAVMPFQNMTNDTLWNIYQVAIQDILINSFSNFPKELKVRHKEPVNSLIKSKGFTDIALIIPSIAGRISRELDAKVFLCGNLKRAGKIIRLNAQLVNSKTTEVIKSFEIDGSASEEVIFRIVDSLKLKVTDFLLMSKLKKEAYFEDQKYAYTSSPQAYRYYQYGQKAFGIPDYTAAVDLFSKAVELDSNYVEALIQLSYAYKNQGLIKEGKQWCIRLYRKRDIVPLYQKAWIDWIYANYFGTPLEEIRCLRQIREIDDQTPDIYYLTGNRYLAMHQYDKAIPEYKKSFELIKKYSTEPGWVFLYAHLAYAYHKTGQYKKEKNLYKKTEKYFPDFPYLIHRQAVLSLVEGDTKKADKYIERYTSVQRTNFVSEGEITANLAGVYSEANILDKAEYYYRQALSADPANPWRQYNLAHFLIENELNINEGLSLIEKAFISDSCNYWFLDCKGWGLFKVGKYGEAMELIDKSWDLKPEYDHNVFLHRKEIREAVNKN